jgi:septum formation protein
MASRRSQTRIILASTSPRRIDLLASAGIRAAALAPECDETRLRGESPGRMVARLALTKAHSIALRLRRTPRERVLVIAADTTVVAPSGGRVLGKPATRAEARAMLRLISGRTHQVLTGFTIIELKGTARRALTRVVSTRVTLRRLSGRQISAYVAGGEPMDKAGSYAAQGKGMNFITSIRGSYTNVVGLPMSELLEVLEKEFGLSVLD